MSFTEVVSLEADTTIRLGGVDRKTNKKNPVSQEGYYLGAKEVESPKAKTGKAYLHVFNTPSGNVGVWGKTNMDQKLRQVTPGTMTRITFTHMQPTINGEMYVYKVETDAGNVLDVSGLSSSTGSTAYDSPGSDENSDVDTDSDEGGDEDTAYIAAQAKKAKVQALLNRNKGK